MTTPKLNRKKVMRLASQAYKASKSFTNSYLFLSKYYKKEFTPKQLIDLANKLQGSTWGQAQSIAWKMARRSLNRKMKLVNDILSDPLFLKKGTYFTERVKDFVPNPACKTVPTEKVVYTEKYGRIVLTPFIEHFITPS